MKKFLTILGVSVLSFSLFVGCGDSEETTTTTEAGTETVTTRSKSVDKGVTEEATEEDASDAAGDDAVSDAISKAVDTLDANLPEDFKDVMAKYMSLTVAIGKNPTKLTEDAANKIQTEITADATELQTLLTSLTQDPTNLNSADLSSAKEKMASINTKLETIAADCGITVDDMSFKDGFNALFGMLLSTAQ